MNRFNSLKTSLMVCAVAAGYLLQSLSPVLAQHFDGQIVSLNECWRYTSSDLMPEDPASDKDNIYIAERGGRVSAISIQTGIRIWSTDFGGEVRSNVVVLGSTVYVATGTVKAGKQRSGVTLVRALSAVTGLPSFDLPVRTDAEVRLVSAGGKLVVLTSDGGVTAFENGRTNAAWHKSLSRGPIGPIFVWLDKLLLASTDMKIYVISVLTGAQINSVSTQSSVSALSMIDGDLVWGDDRGEVVRYDLAAGSVYWRFKNGARISGLSTTEEGVLAASLDNFTYLISPYYGRVRWKKRLPARLESLTSYGQDLVAVQAVGEPIVTLLSADSGKTVGQITVGDDSFIRPPLAAGDRLILFTNRQLIASRLSPCPEK